MGGRTAGPGGHDMKILAAALGALTIALGLGGIVQAQDITDEEAAFVLHNSEFIIEHEIGHLFIGEFNLPVLGKEEDAADSLAAWLLLTSSDAEAPDILIDSADGWYFSQDADGVDAAEDDSYYYDEHSLDLQRAYSIVCMMVGADPEGYADIAEAYELPEDRVDTCGGIYQQVDASWTTLLEPYLRGDGDEGETISFVYEESQADPEMAQFFQDSEFLEKSAALVTDKVILPRPLTFVAKDCGEENAYYSYSDAQVTFCYELPAFYVNLYRNYIASLDEESGE